MSRSEPTISHQTTPELRESWVSLIKRYEPFAWYGHLTFKDHVHPEQADKRFRRWLNKINETLFGLRYRKHGEGVYGFKAIEHQRRGVIHFHFLMGGGVERLRRLTYMDLWAAENGWARIYPYDSNQGAARYVSKYVLKGGEIDPFFSPAARGRFGGEPVQLSLLR